jgi:RNA polymerase sigma factor (TIGR02999 family)
MTHPAPDGVPTFPGARAAAEGAGDRDGDPAEPPPAEVTRLLAAWGAGDRAALDALLPAVYAELRRQAQRALRREADGHTLQPTALVHEAYLRLVDQRAVRFESRAQFFGVAARCMRQVLVDAARTRQATKRGGGAQAVTLGALDAAGAVGAAGAAADRDVDVLALDEALARLAAIDPGQARLVELRYFAGLTLDETAAALGVSAATVSREWSVARRWLRRELER